MALTPFPASYWQTEPLIYIELPRLFADDGWKSVQLPELPGPTRPKPELRTLLRMQHDYDRSGSVGMPEIIDEKDNTSSQFMRVVMFAAGLAPEHHRPVRGDGHRSARSS